MYCVNKYMYCVNNQSVCLAILSSICERRQTDRQTDRQAATCLSVCPSVHSPYIRTSGDKSSTKPSVTVHVSFSLCADEIIPLKPSGPYMYRTVVTICAAQWSLYVPHSSHYMYRTVVTICAAQWSLYVPHSGHYMYRTVVTI